MRKRSPFTYTVMLLLVILATANGNAVADTEFVQNGPREQTLVHFSDRCPAAEPAPESFIAAFALLVLPSLIKAAIKGVGKALQKAGEETIYSTTGTGSDFLYSYTTDPNQKPISLTQFTLNQDVRCIIVAHGLVSGEAINIDFKNHGFFKRDYSEPIGVAEEGKGPQLRTISLAAHLNAEMGLTSTPRFYGEFDIDLPEYDQSVFNIQPRTIYYGRRLKPGNNKIGKVKELVVVFSFSNPGTGAEASDDTFAFYPYQLVKPGKPQLFTDPRLLHNDRSLTMKLPPVSSNGTSKLEKLNAAKAALKVAQADEQSILLQEEPRVKAAKEALDKKRAELESPLRTAQIELEIARKRNAIPDETQPIIDRISTELKKLNDSQLLKQLENDLSDAERNVRPTDRTENARKLVKGLEERVLILENSIRYATPFNLKVTLNETANGNAFLAALGDMLTEQADSVADKAVTAITPKTPEEQASKLSAEATFRTDAVTAVDEWRKSKVAYDAAPSGQKDNAWSGLRIKYLSAKLTCNTATLNEIVEPVCLTLEAPPAAPAP